MPVRLILLGLLAAVLIVLAVWIILRCRLTPEERERRRRLQVNSSGRMADGVLNDIEGRTLYYSYSIRGVDYRASQDVSGLDAIVDWERDSLIGPVMLKFAPGNPANSIVVCEEWSGLRSRMTLGTTEEAGSG